VSGASSTLVASAPVAGGEEQYCLKTPVWTYNARDYDVTRPTGLQHPNSGGRELCGQDPGQHGLDVARRSVCGITLYSRSCTGAGPGRRLPSWAWAAWAHGREDSQRPGAEVSVLSHTLSKREDGCASGSHYYATSDPATFSDLAGSFDLIVNTLRSTSTSTPTSIFWLSTAHGRGRPASRPLWVEGRRPGFDAEVIGRSSIGGIRETQEMLDFCAERAIAPEIEMISVANIGSAYDRVVRSDVRYRFVIDTATLAETRL